MDYLSTGGLVRFLPRPVAFTIDPEIDAANNPHNGHKKRPEENEPHHQFTRVKVRYA